MVIFFRGHEKPNIWRGLVVSQAIEMKIYFRYIACDYGVGNLVLRFGF